MDVIILSTGKSLSVYMSQHTLNMLDDIRQKNNTSISDAVSQAVKNMAVQTFAGVRISEGAYICLSRGYFDLLQCVPFEDGTVMIFMKPEAMDNDFVSSGKEKLQSYLADAKGSDFYHNE